MRTLKTNLRALATWVVFTSVLFSSVPHADAASANAPAFRARQTISRLVDRSPTLRLAVSNLGSKELREKIESAAVAKPKEALVGVGHTLLFMTVLAGLDLTAREIKKNGGLATLTPTHLSAIVANVAKAIVDSPQIWTAIVGSSALSLAQKPAQAIGQVLLHPRLRATFAPILARTISSTIAFVGWEFGSQLYTEATLLLDSKADFELASSASGLGRGVLATALSTKARTASVKDQNSSRVAKTMMQNMLRILLYDSKLRSEWFSNTFRLHIMTGEFSTLLTSMIAAGAVGTMIFPGGGTLVGLVFGLVGGVASMFIPQTTKDRITYGFQGARAYGLTFWMFRNANRMTSFLTVPEVCTETCAQDFTAEMRDRHDLRSRLMTVQWERLLHDYLTTKSFGPDALSRFAAMREIYVTDNSRIGKLQIVEPRITAQGAYHAVFKDEAIRISSMIQFIDALTEEARTNPKSESLLKFVEAAHARGFDESQAVTEWRQSA